MAFATHCFNLCLSYSRIEKQGCCKTADIGPGISEIKSSNGSIEVEVRGWELQAYVSSGVYRYNHEGNLR